MPSLSPFLFFESDAIPLLLLVCGPLEEESPWELGTVKKINSYLERNALLKPIIYVESAKNARRRWIASGLDRQWIESFIEMREEEKSLATSWKEQQSRKTVFEQAPTILMVDEGTPCWHDPGTLFVSRCYELGRAVEVTALPQSATVALLMSGFVLDRVQHWGFPPPGSALKERHQFWKDFRAATWTSIVMDTAYRLEQCLSELRQAALELESSGAKSVSYRHYQYALLRDGQRATQDFSLGTLEQMWDHLQQQKKNQLWEKKDFILVQSPK